MAGQVSSSTSGENVGLTQSNVSKQEAFVLGQRQTPQSGYSLADLRGGIKRAPSTKCCVTELDSWLGWREVGSQVLALQRCGGVGWKQLEPPLDDLPKPVTQQAGWQEGDLQPL